MSQCVAAPHGKIYGAFLPSGGQRISFIVPPYRSNQSIRIHLQWQADSVVQACVASNMRISSGPVHPVDYITQAHYSVLNVYVIIQHR